MKKIIVDCIMFMGLSTIIASLIYLFVIKVFDSAWDDFWHWCKSIAFFDYHWQPQTPLKNNKAYIDIKKYPKDCELDIENNNINWENVISGEKAFRQHLYTFINTPKEKYSIYPEEYGNEHAETIFNVKNSKEFKREAEYMANNIINHEHFKDYIQECYSIKRKRNVLYIEFKLYGKPETYICKIPKTKTKNK